MIDSSRPSYLVHLAVEAPAIHVPALGTYDDPDNFFNESVRISKAKRSGNNWLFYKSSRMVRHTDVHCIAGFAWFGCCRWRWIGVVHNQVAVIVSFEIVRGIVVNNDNLVPLACDGKVGLDKDWLFRSTLCTKQNVLARLVSSEPGHGPSEGFAPVFVT